MTTTSARTDTGLSALRQEVLDELHAAWRDGEALLQGLDDEATTWRPAPERWSVGDCINHLIVTGELYLPLIERAITQGQRDPRARLRPGAVERPLGRFAQALVRSQEPPVRRRLRSPRAMATLPPRSADVLRADWVALHETLEAWVRDSAALDLSRLTLRSPVMPLLRMRLDTALRFLLAHERRHLWQGWAVRRHERFPAKER